MNPVSFPIQPGMDVVGSDDHFVGLATKVRDGDFLVHRSMLRETYVPLSAVREVRDDRIVLAITAEQVDAMNWPGPLDSDE